MRIGLRVDVDTFRGTRLGVPAICKLLARQGITASFFFTVGPDNMGRHLRRLLRPSFLWKMLRTRAVGLYGWDILLKGTFRPGPVIGEKLAGVIQDTADAGHEIGLHAWDHHRWQTHVDAMDGGDIRHSLETGVDLLTRILGHPPDCSAAPAWKSTDSALTEKDRFPFVYNSDCRGDHVFLPIVGGRTLRQPQVPVTLPTYDEVIGNSGISDENYNEYMLSLLDPAGLNVLTVHAEVEGISRLGMFDRFLSTARSSGMAFCTLGSFLEGSTSLPAAPLIPGHVPGRDGWVSLQGPSVAVDEEIRP